MTNHLKFNKDKQPILNLGQSDSVCTDRQGNKRLEDSTAERDLAVLIDGKLNMSAAPWQPGGPALWGASGQASPAGLG